jgi:photosystem II stability/assembly factor-like uncharacterized protein
MGHIRSAHGIAAAIAAAASIAVAPIPADAAHHHRHFSPESVSAISHRDWWAIGKGGVVHTIDGGRTFSRVTRSHHDDLILVASASTIYLAGPHLIVTHDGGATWQRLDLGGHVSNVVTANGYAFATVGGRRHSGIERALVGSDTWTTLNVPGRLSGVEWANSSHVFGVTHVKERRHEGNERLLVSDDNGSTWKRHHLPIEDLACTVEQIKPPVLWEHCATGMMSGVWRSRSNGAHFYNPVKHEGQSGEPNSAVFGAASSRTALVGWQDLRRTSDAGRSWREVGPTPKRDAWWGSITFSDKRHGFAIRTTARHSQLWRTHDAGAHWHLAHLPRR